MLNKNEKSILKTLHYSDMFDYPLSEKEIKKYFLKEKNSLFDKTDLEKLIAKKLVFSRNGFFALSEKKLFLRENLKFENERKIKIAYKYATFLFKIPTIETIAISGSLAVFNAKKNDDIDFFIISKKNSVWITRLLSVIFLRIKGVRRRKNEKKLKDKICLNMFLDKTKLELVKEMKNLYTAHEIVQLRPIFDRNNTYDFFLKENLWLKNFMPYQFFYKNKILFKIKDNFWDKILIIFLQIFEKPVFIIQFLYMKNKITKEKVTSKMLAFHPNDLTGKIINQYFAKIKDL